MGDIKRDLWRGSKLKLEKDADGLGLEFGVHDSALKYYFNTILAANVSISTAII